MTPTRTNTSAAAVDGLRRWTGRGPDVTAVAPGRVNLIGDHTDYCGGLALPFAIDQVAAVSVFRRTDRVVRLLSLQYDGVITAGADAATGWARLPVGVLKVLTEHLGDLRGMDIVLTSDVPAGSGLSSSAAIACALALAVHELHGGGLTRPELARVCQRAENDIVGAPTGLLDQTASLLAQAGSVLLVDFTDATVRHVPFDLVETSLLVVDTLERHDNTGPGYADRRSACERAALSLGLPTLRSAGRAHVEAELQGELLQRARHVVTENDRVRRAVAALETGRADLLGAAMSDSHRSLRDDYEVSTPRLDAAVRAAEEAGAHGARVTGAGMGGCAVVCTPRDLVPAVTDAVVAAYLAQGWEPPAVTEVAPCSGATVVDA